MLFIPDKDIAQSAATLATRVQNAKLPPDLANFLEFILSTIGQEQPVEVLTHDRQRPMAQVACILGIEVEQILDCARQGRLHVDQRGYVDLASVAETVCGWDDSAD